MSLPFEITSLVDLHLKNDARTLVACLLEELRILNFGKNPKFRYEACNAHIPNHRLAVKTQQKISQILNISVLSQSAKRVAPQFTTLLP